MTFSFPLPQTLKNSAVTRKSHPGSGILICSTNGCGGSLSGIQDVFSSAKENTEIRVGEGCFFLPLLAFIFSVLQPLLYLHAVKNNHLLHESVLCMRFFLDKMSSILSR